MEIEINALTRQNIIVAATAALLALVTVMALLGRAVTPVDAGMAALLTPARWQEYRLARQARGEATLLQQDAMALQALLAARHLEPVAAQLLAQRIYANHQGQGTAVTLPARKALIAAAQDAALAAAGSEPVAQAIDAYNTAKQRIELLAQAGPASGIGPGEVGLPSESTPSDGGVAPASGSRPSVAQPTGSARP
jgi:hypothetical protein